MPREIIHQSSWAQTAANNAIELYSSTQQNEQPLLFIGGVHGDEPEGVELATQFFKVVAKKQQF